MMKYKFDDYYTFTFKTVQHRNTYHFEDDYGRSHEIIFTSLVKDDKGKWSQRISKVDWAVYEDRESGILTIKNTPKSMMTKIWFSGMQVMKHKLFLEETEYVGTNPTKTSTKNIWPRAINRLDFLSDTFVPENSWFTLSQEFLDILEKYKDLSPIYIFRNPNYKKTVN